MDCEILTVGSELLLGQTVDTNAAEMGRMLAASGWRVRRRASVSDDPARIEAALGEALERTGTVIVSGGLGPTADDVTVAGAAAALGRRVVRDARVMAQLEERYRRRGIAMPSSNARQADVPEGAAILENPLGTAPGLWIEDGARLAVLLPGVPKEMRAMMEREVVPRLARRAGESSHGAAVVRSRTVRTTGISEAALADALGDYQRLLGDRLSLAFLPGYAGTDLVLTACDVGEAEADTILARAVEALRPRVGPHAYGEAGDDLAAVALRQLEAAGATLALAESCTGGLLGARLTAVPGSSRVFVGGVVAYADDVKLDLLGVAAETLAVHGAVSEQVAREMAEGASRVLGADAAIAITGIAGPDGGSAAKPVGTVFIAVRWQGAVRAFNYVFPGDREDIRQRAAQWALDRLRRVAAGTL